ncbi:MAG: hypothetical protein RML73_08655 [Anaerolineae bacterium]|nr:hypothetical protein [Anaerolineae bacterium]
MRKHYLRFREAETSYVMKCLKNSESCALVGVGSIGKSNLVHHLCDDDTLRHYLGDEQAAKTKVIVIDPYMMVAFDEAAPLSVRVWAGFEMLMHRLYIAFHPFDILGDDLDSFVNAYRALQDGTNPLHAMMALRYFERGINLLLKHDVRVAFLFDEFEEVMFRMPPKFFQALRGLRDMYKKSLSYLTFSREPLNNIAQRVGYPMESIESFNELFNDRILFVGPYTTIDAHAMVERLMQTEGKQLSGQTIDYLIQVSGGYAGLLRAAYRAIHDFGNVDPADLLGDALTHRLINRLPIYNECATIWKSLDVAEQEVLRMVLAGRSVREANYETQMAIAMLVRKGLLRPEGSLLRVNPPLLQLYLRGI